MAGKRILIIDDEEAIQAVVKLGLKMEAGWDTLTATSGLDGIAQAAIEQPDAILLDMMMPDMDGVTTFDKLRSDAKTQAIPVILLTAKMQAADQQLPNRIAAAGIIMKPFNSLTLASQVAKILNWSL